ncbi:MAG: peptidase M23, partial [Alphaproteobacteria bacterium]|nr:peptidase M23 [Alphaproteobacteria bacterium]
KEGGARISTPAEGKVFIAYGGKTEEGDESKGIRIRTRNGAAVTAPRAGEVVYTGPFLDYGNLIIIRHDGKHHSLLAGMSNMQAKVGQKVIKGEPVGVMGSGDSGTGLYVEIRKDNKPINPVPWLSAG